MTSSEALGEPKSPAAPRFGVLRRLRSDLVDAALRSRGLSAAQRRALRRGRLLCDYADGMVLRGAAVRGGSSDARAGRLYRKAAGMLADLGPSSTALRFPQTSAPAPLRPGEGRGAEPTSLALATAAHELLDEVDAPRRLRRLMTRAIGLVLGAFAIVATLLVIAVPAVRGVVFPKDLATGKRWTASSAEPKYGALAGTLGEDRGAVLFVHTTNESSPWVSIDLGSRVAVSGVRVVNRADCCEDRALPLAVEVSLDGKAWTQVARRRAEFFTWSTSFPQTTARYLRLRADRKTFLHLQDVSIY